MDSMADLKREYFLKGGPIGVLVIHGFTSTPAEVYELGCRLHQAGFTVLGILLKGHGTDVDDFKRSTEKDWMDSAREGLERLKKQCGTVYVAGHSMGGLLALYLAEHFSVDKLILLAPAVVYRDKVTYLAGLARFFIREYTWPVEERPESERQYFLGYKRFPMVAVHRMTKLQRLARKNLSAVKTPTLLIVARKDPLVHVSTAKVLEQGLQVPLTTVWLEESGHSVGVECEKEKVFEACISFLQPLELRG